MLLRHCRHSGNLCALECQRSCKTSLTPQNPNTHRDQTSSRSFRFARAAPPVSVRMPTSRARLPLSRANSLSGSRCCRLECQGRSSWNLCFGDCIVSIQHTSTSSLSPPPFLSPRPLSLSVSHPCCPHPLLRCLAPCTVLVDSIAAKERQGLQSLRGQGLGLW